MARDSVYSEQLKKYTNKTMDTRSGYRPSKVKSSFESMPETMVIQKEIANLTEQIRTLIRRKKTLSRQLKRSGQRKLKVEYLNKPILLYALRLEDDCWYIGMTRNIEKRFRVHQKGKGSVWTRIHQALEIHETRHTGLNEDADVAKLEDKMTIEYALKYGKEFVRGGGYCQTKPNWPSEVRGIDVVSKAIEVSRSMID